MYECCVYKVWTMQLLTKIWCSPPWKVGAYLRDEEAQTSIVSSAAEPEDEAGE